MHPSTNKTSHVLTGISVTLDKGMYTWRHKQFYKLDFSTFYLSELYAIFLVLALLVLSLPVFLPPTPAWLIVVDYI